MPTIMDSLIYLATPYSANKNLSDESKLNIQEARFQEAMRVAAALMKDGHYIYSPIVHCHQMACRFGLPKDWQYWQHYLKVMLPRCDELWVVVMAGWQESTGVQAEIVLARELKKPVRYVDPKTCKVFSYDTSS
jgi:hypothetical protein